MEDKKYSDIEAYLGGDMSETEAKDFELLMAKDAKLKQDVELYNSINYHIGGQFKDEDFLHNEYTKKIKVFLESNEAESTRQLLESAKNKYSNKDSFFTKNRTVLIASAAVLVLIFVLRIGIPFNSQTIDDFYFDYYDNKDLPSFVKRDNSQNQLSAIIETFQKENYRKTINAIDDYKESSSNFNILIYLYKGMAHLKLDENKEALKAFREVSKSSILDKSKGLWFEALTFLKLKENDNAILILEKITEDPSNFKYKEANELLRKLN